MITPDLECSKYLPEMTQQNMDKWPGHCISILLCVLFLEYNVRANSRCSKFNSSSNNTNIHLNGSSGTIYSPDFSLISPYLSNTKCDWTISGPIGYVIKLTFILFELEPVSSSKSGCSGTDLVRVYDGWQSSSRVLGVYCGKLGRFSLKSTGRFLLVQFRSNLVIEGKGFKATFEVIKNVEQDPPKGGTVSIALIIGGATVSIIIVIGIIFFAIGGKKSFRQRKRARRRMSRLNLGSRVSMSSSLARLPSVKSLPRSTPRSERQSLGRSILSSRSGASSIFVQRNLSLPQLIVTNEEGKETKILPERELRIRVLVHTSPFSKRRFNKLRRLSTDFSTLPPVKRSNQVSPHAAHAQSYRVKSQSTSGRTRSETH